MNRLFSTFADGWPGGGILLLRILAGCALIDRGVAASGAPVYTGFTVLQISGIGAGVLMLGGLWTPLVGVLIGIAESWIAFTHTGAPGIAIILAILGVSLAMIGPGAWSIDARLYGRKQLLPPEH